MAIAFDAVSQGSDFYDTATTLTVSHTAAGSNRLAVVGFASRGGSITGVTYDGVAMTEISSTTGGPYFTDIRLYYLVNPPTGAKDVVGTHSAGGYEIMFVHTYTGVDQINPTDGHDEYASASTDSMVTTITTTKDNAWLVGYVVRNTGPITISYSAGADTTLRSTTADEWFQSADSNGPKTPAGSASLTINNVQAGAFAMLTAAIAPSTSLEVSPLPGFFRS